MEFDFGILLTGAVVALGFIIAVIWIMLPFVLIGLRNDQKKAHDAQLRMMSAMLTHLRAIEGYTRADYEREEIKRASEIPIADLISGGDSVADSNDNPAG